MCQALSDQNLQRNYTTRVVYFILLGYGVCSKVVYKLVQCLLEQISQKDNFLNEKQRQNKRWNFTGDSFVE